MGKREQPEGASGAPAPEKYDTVGEGGGRNGPRDYLPPSHYAEAKQDDYDNVDDDQSARSEYSDNEDGNLVSDSILVWFSYHIIQLRVYFLLDLTCFYG